MDVNHIRAAVPLLVVQDQILRAPLLNWYLNGKFMTELQGFQARPDVDVRPLTVVNVNELESMVNSAEAFNFDFTYALHHKTVRDPEALMELQMWLMQFQDYGRGQSASTKRVFDESQTPMFGYLITILHQRRGKFVVSEHACYQQLRRKLRRGVQ